MQPDFPEGLDVDDVFRVIDAALAEDIGQGDITSEAVIPPDTRFTGTFRARQDMVVAGLPIAAAVIHRVVPEASWQAAVADGDFITAGATLAVMEGPAAKLLTAERTALNLLQHLSGIATLTRTYVDAIEGTGAVLLDTRKTIPGLRRMAKYASRMGGATNHRIRLDDGVLIKDNHIAANGSLTETVKAALDKGLTDIRVECDTLEQVGEAIDAGAHSLLLDNMEPDTLKEAVAIVGGRIPLEASGGITLDTIRAKALTGVDFLSVGRLTQSAAAVDIGLDWTGSDSAS